MKHGRLSAAFVPHAAMLRTIMLAAVLPAVLLLAVLLLAACNGRTVQERERGRAYELRSRYIAGIDRFERTLAVLDSVVGSNTAPAARGEAVLRAFVAARRAYKGIEFLAAHYAPATAEAINGAPIPIVEEDDPNQIAVPPEGLQAIEERLADARPTDARLSDARLLDAQADTLRSDVRVLRSSVRRLRAYAAALHIDDAHVFDAMREAIARMASLGLSGFDAPIVRSGIAESAEVMRSLRATYLLYAPLVRESASGLDSTTAALLDGAERALEQGGDFLTFDRLAFIRAYADPLLRAVTETQRALGVPFPTERRPFSPRAVTMFSGDSFDPWAFAPGYAERGTGARAELGRLLFFDPILSGDGLRSCASCHRPERAFADGRERSVAFGLDGMVERNAPTLLNAALQAGYFYDRRVTFLEDQAAAVVANPAEMHGSFERAAHALAASPEYARRFTEAFGSGSAGPGAGRATGAVTEERMRMALAAYLRTLVRMNSPFDRYVRGEIDTIGADVRHGFNLFMGKARCGTCHFAPLFNGTRPPQYADSEMEIIGTTTRFDTVAPALDPDPGRFRVHGITIDRFAFKTPTLRNAALTAPYMHNGAFATLEDVVAFYDHGGGAGLGAAPPRQTLSADRLDLTAEERAAIVAFIRSLTDTSGEAAARPASLPRLADGGEREVGGRY